MQVLAVFVLATAAATTCVDLKSAEDFVILAKSGISTVPDSAITGDIGVSPIAASAMTSFSLIMDVTNTFFTSLQITGQAYASDYTSPTPSKMTTAISDMETAYTDTAGRPVDDENKDIKSGLITEETFRAGVYNWGSDVMFSSDIYIKSCSNDIIIFQTTGKRRRGKRREGQLQNGGTLGFCGKPQVSNIFRQVVGFVDAGTTSQLEGVFLAKTHAAFKASSSLDGRILAQTACTLDEATIVEP